MKTLVISDIHEYHKQLKDALANAITKCGANA